MMAKIYLALRGFIRHHVLHIDDRSQLEIALFHGLKLGKDCFIMGECIIDPGHCWLIEIGDRVTLAPRVHILAHDASTKRPLGYSRLGCVRIGNDVFVGAGTIILPGVTIGDHVVIGAGSVVSHDIPEGLVAVGAPARVVGTYEDFVEKNREKMKHQPCYDYSYTIGRITEQKRQEMTYAIREAKGGYVQ